MKAPRNKKDESRTPEEQNENIPLPPGCSAENEIADDEILEIKVGEYVKGRIIEVKPIKTVTMRKENNLITFNDDERGRIKFWSCGYINNFLVSNPDYGNYDITFQRIADVQFKAGLGAMYRIFIHS